MGFEEYVKFMKLKDEWENKVDNIIAKMREVGALDYCGYVDEIEYEKAAAEKIRWVMDNLNGYDQILHTISGADKHKYAAPNHILIDDRDKAILPWRKAGGIGILHTSAADTITQLQKLGL